MTIPQRSDKFFAWRGKEITRLEGFSDAVFAFSLTLLVVSLEVPKTFNQLLDIMRGFLAFATCFAMLMSLWHVHFIFFRRFGLVDTTTIVYNSVLMFVVMFYVYPLKFVFTLVVNAMFGIPFAQPPLEPGQGGDMMLFYNVGFITVFALYYLLYRHAGRQVYEPALSNVETAVIRNTQRGFLINIGFGLLSTVIILIGGSAWSAWAGLIYWLIGPAMGFNGYWSHKKLDRLSRSAS